MHSIIKSDAVKFLQGLEPDSVDLVFGSPPYEEARLYLEEGKDLNISRKTEVWVRWMRSVYYAASVCCHGLIAFVVEGQTRNFRYSAGPVLLMADLHRAGFNLRKPPIFHRIGIPGSGGPDWLRNDYEFIVCATRPGKLSWSDNTAAGHPPLWAPGGAMSNRNAEGRRKNYLDGPKVNGRRVAKGYRAGNTTYDDSYTPPEKANPGNKIQQTYTAGEVSELLAESGNVRSHKVGGGLMGGDQYSSQNEAPFPEALADFFVRSFCPPGGLVVDPFSGSGTTAAVAIRNGRRFAGCDLRQSQVDLGLARLAAEQPTTTPKG